MADKSLNALQIAELMASEHDAFARAIADNCPLPVFRVDAHGAWLNVNSAMQKLLDVSELDLKGQKWQKCLNPQHADQCKLDWKNFVESKAKTAKLTLKLIDANNNVLSVHVTLCEMPKNNYVGFAIPICETPFNCPVHGFLLGNIAYPSTKEVDALSLAPRKRK